MMPAGLRARVGDLRQLASLRSLVLADGPEAGVAALAFSTGGGLDFLVLAGRGLDIGTLNYRGAPLAWQSPVGFRHPGLIAAEAEGGRGFNRGFSGLLVTCGLDHIRQPLGPQPLHGRLPYSPARVTAAGEDWDRDEPVLYCEGEIVQARYGGEALRLCRRIEAPIGGTELRLIDRVENLGAQSQPHALLYHFNLGYPAITDGSRVSLDGTALGGPLRLADGAGLGTPLCYDAGPGDAECRLTTPVADAAPPFSLQLGFSADTLPVLQVWQDLRPRAGVLAIEPTTSSRMADGDSRPGITLAPGERRDYRLSLRLSGPAPTIDWTR